MIQALEGFYHPSNSGRWTFALTKLLQLLAQEFLRRLKLGQH